jgi:oxygen-independent coproporphyrinogen-3 oxidase
MFSLYIHIPFCIKRCGYCDFYSKELNFVPNNYINTIVNKIEKSHIKGTVSSIFLGGGTPSLIDTKNLNKLFNAIYKKWDIEKKCEITIEANPDTVPKKKLTEFKKVGINRISIGAQSFNNRVLKILDRTHNPKNVFMAIDYANELNLKTSLDLMYGTPTESIYDWEQTVKTAISTGVKHISIYALELHKSVPLYKKYKELDENLLVRKYNLADKLLARAGFEWYEISNFSNGKNNMSQHNLNYWLLKNDYLGLGTSAASKINNKRFLELENEKIKIEMLSKKEQLTEQIMLNLRTKFGLNISLVDKNKLNSLISDKLIYIKNDKVILTLKGRMLADTVIRALI